MVLANQEFTKAIRQLAQSASATSVFQVSESQKEKQRDVEYIVRLIAHTFVEYDTSLDVQEFLDSAIVNVLSNQDQDHVIETASWAIDILHEACGEKALIPSDAAPDGIAGRFSLRALEAIAAGIARNKRSIEALPAPKQFVSDKIAAFWHQAEVPEMSASGLRGTVRLQRTIPFGAQWFTPDA